MRDKEGTTMNNFVIISGCSGGGKSTLLAELQRRGHAVVEEPGRRVVQQELRTGGRALPWLDLVGFLRRLIAMAQDDHAKAPRDSKHWVFFDRSLIDAASALQTLTNEPALARLGQACDYNPQVFLAPPWPEIYVQDTERRHGLDAAVGEFEQLQRVYPLLGYTVSLLPKVSVAERADFVLSTLASN
ncbi:AAA family ATPase [Ectopseudomonas khazarica]|uniref:AAA family ATPase n=1 Tax=Ectopseudomonas khazarica TaxID=2502979 RepID=UPI003A8D9B65